MPQALFDYDDDDVTDAFDTDTDADWDEHVPVRKIWVHPGIDLPTAAFADPDVFDDHATTKGQSGGTISISIGTAKLRFDCPVCGTQTTASSPLTYSHFRQLHGVACCTDCGESLVAHQSPPDEWTPPDKRQATPRATGGVYGRPGP